MNFLGNILWFIFGGFLSGLSWCLSGIIWCITIIGIPYGKQCFKFDSLAFAPFGKTVSGRLPERHRRRFLSHRPKAQKETGGEKAGTGA